MAVVRPKSLQLTWIPLSLLTSNPSPNPVSSIFKVFLESSLFSPSPLFHSTPCLPSLPLHQCILLTQFSSQHSPSEPVEMEIWSCQLLRKNCPLALHLTQHKSLRPFCLIWADPVLLSYAPPLDSPHSRYADFLLFLHTRHPHWGPRTSSLPGRLFPREPHSPLPSSPPGLCWNVSCLLRPPWHHTHSPALLPPLPLYFSLLIAFLIIWHAIYFNYLFVYHLSPQWSISTMSKSIFYFILFMAVPRTSRTVSGL